MALTITEALAEIKTIQARLTKKREFITRYIARQDGQKEYQLQKYRSQSGLGYEVVLIPAVLRS